ncbi:MAG: hypothetical protein NTV79_06520 [Candidatus Aureabacteria bacterium]|nr:hypothetical protein [Candidatus Auribacterota bacterium]
MRIISWTIPPLLAIVLAGCGPKKEEAPLEGGKVFSAEVDVVDILAPDRIECARMLPDGSPMTVRAQGDFPKSLKRTDFIQIRGIVVKCQKIKEVLFVDLMAAEIVRRIKR